MAYNGWKNRETWNVALYIGNDEAMYRAADRFMQKYKGKAPYDDFIQWEGLGASRTPDGVHWVSPKISRAELNRAMREFAPKKAKRRTTHRVKR